MVSIHFLAELVLGLLGSQSGLPGFTEFWVNVVGVVAISGKFDTVFR